MRRLSLLIAIGSICGFTLLFASDLLARERGFDIKRLPKGKDITLPHPATTFVPINERVTLSSTDLPQTIKLSSINVKRGRAVPFRVAIYDSNSVRVKYVTIRPGLPYVYIYSSIGSISLIGEPPAGVKRGKKSSGYTLRIDSNKPLGIAR